MTKKPKIIIFDIETSPVEYLKFQKDKSPFFNTEGIVNDSYMVSAAWKVLDGKQVYTVSSPKVWNDYTAVKKLYDALSTADILVGHNIDKFDLKYFNSRLIYHSLPPLPSIPTIDTLKQVKKIAGFTSNKLDYLSQILNDDQKRHTTFNLWKQVVAGSRQALVEMVQYNKHDVVVGEKLYKRLLPYMKPNIHLGVLTGKDRRCSCPNCGSEHVKKNGIRITATGLKRQEMQCMDCGSYHRLPLVAINVG